MYNMGLDKKINNYTFLRVYEMVTETMDRGCVTVIFYFDLEKAFNTVPHKQLVAKLKTACSDGRIINWKIDYLNEGKQRVVIRSEKSQWCKHGTVNAPIIFLTYINDLPTDIK